MPRLLCALYPMFLFEPVPSKLAPHAVNTEQFLGNCVNFVGIFVSVPTPPRILRFSRFLRQTLRPRILHPHPSFSHKLISCEVLIFCDCQRPLSAGASVMVGCDKTLSVSTVLLAVLKEP